MAGLATTGFSVLTFEEIRDAINADLRDAFGKSIDLSDNSTLGQLVAIQAERLSLLWELAEAIHSAQDPDKATGDRLDSLAAFTGTIRESAEPSTVTLTLTGDDATSVPTGSRASTDSTDQDFETTEDVTIAALSAWAPSTAYSVGDRVTNDSRAYECITAGTSAGSGGPTTTGATITDNTAEWTYLGEGTAAVDAEAESVDNGEVVALARDIIDIETPIGGWKSVINLLDAEEGRLKETDAELRVRRENELAQAGSTTKDALRAALLQVENVDAVTVFVNNTMTTDADGVPPKAVEALVQGGANQDIFDALLANIAAGIEAHGDVTGTAEDEQGISEAVAFSRPTEVDIHVNVTLTYDTDEYPDDGDTQIKQAIVDYGDAQPTGKDAVQAALIAQCFKVDGVLDVPTLELKKTGGAFGTSTVSISLRELAVYDTSRISVTSSSGTP